jgi:hypothetical protein
MSGSLGAGLLQGRVVRGGYAELVRKIAQLASGIGLGDHDCRCNSDLLSSNSSSAR